MSDEIRPPEDERDEGMHAFIDEAGDTIPPDTEERDEGMAAGKMEVQPEDLPEDPGVPTEPLQPPDEEAMTGAPLISPDIARLADLDTKSEAPKQPEILSADPAMLNLLVTDQDVHQLWQRANRLQAAVALESQNLDTGRQLLNHIRDGRNEILAGRDHFEEAERFINEVDFRLAFSRAVRQATRRFSWWLMTYEIVIGTFLLAMLIIGFTTHAFAGADALAVSTPAAVENAPEGLDSNAANQDEGTTLSRSEHCQEQGGLDCLTPDMIYLLVTMIWGGLGGVIGALFSLKEHVSEEQDFDPQHTMWYIISPPMGIAVAAGVYLVMRAGLLSLVSSSDIQSPIIFYVIGFLSGFRHNVFTGLVRRVLNTLQVEEEKETIPPPEAPKKPEAQSEMFQPVQPPKPPKEPTEEEHVGGVG